MSNFFQIKGTCNLNKNLPVLYERANKIEIEMKRNLIKKNDLKLFKIL